MESQFDQNLELCWEGMSIISDADQWLVENGIVSEDSKDLLLLEKYLHDLTSGENVTSGVYYHAVFKGENYILISAIDTTVL